MSTVAACARRLLRCGGFVVVLPCAVMPLSAQTFGGPGTSPFARDYRVDMAIPEAPAFKLLTVEKSAILRPGIATELNTMLSHFVDAGQFRVPESLGIEISPALLIGGPRLQRATYQQQRLLYATRFSAATATTPDSGRDVAFGLRFGLVNEADLRTDDGFQNDTALQITPLLTRINAIHSAALERMGRPGQRPPGPPVYSPEEREEIEELSDQIRDRWAERYWNARAFDVALGMRASALDRFGADTRITEYGAWATYAHGFGDWGQLLLGGRAAGERDHSASDFDGVLDLGLRLYVGTNIIKGFVELQNEAHRKLKPELFINSGAEIRFMDWVWAAASLGFARAPGGGTTTVTSVKFQTTFPHM